MSELDATFVNLDPPPPAVSPPGRDFTDRLSAAMGAFPSTGGTVWFPPGDYHIRTPFSVPARVTLAFAPGARIVPLRPEPIPARLQDAVLLIAGVIDANLDAIFATEATAPADLTGTSRRVGRVVLVGEGNPRVYVEWWGAASGTSPRTAEVNRSAIEAALRASCLDRDALTTGAPRPPLTVCLPGSYEIDRPIVVASGPGAPFVRGVAIEGGPSARGSATLACGETFTGATATGVARDEMLAFERVAQVELRGVSMHARGRAATCLRVVTALATDRVDHVITLSRCTFEGARDQQAHLRDASTADPGAGSVSAFVRGCGVRLDNKGHVGAFVLDRSQSTGLLVEGAFRFAVAVFDSVFDGYFARGVRVIGARSAVSGCRFMSRSLDSDPFPRDAAIELAASGAPLAPPPALTASGSVATTGSFLRVLPTATSKQQKPRNEAPWAAPVLLGITHLVDRKRSFGAYWPPAVVWHGAVPTDARPLPPPGDARLLLLGCTFESPQDIRPPPEPPMIGLNPPFIPRVFVNPNLARVFNVATFREDVVSPIGSFEFARRDIGRSLGPSEAVEGPAAESFRRLIVRGGVDGMGYVAANLLAAWADGLFDSL